MTVLRSRNLRDLISLLQLAKTFDVYFRQKKIFVLPQSVAYPPKVIATGTSSNVVYLLDALDPDEHKCV